MLSDIEAHVQRLHECLSNSYGPECAQSSISEIIYICGENINSQTIKYCLSLFFKREKSLLHFLRRTIGKDEYRSCKVELLQFLNRFIIEANKLIVPFATEIKDLCMILFNSDKYSDVRCSTFPILSKILELCADNPEVSSNLNVEKIVKDYFLAFSSPSKLTATLKAHMYTMLGFICLHYPETMITYSDKILSLFLDSLKTEMETKGRKPDFNVIAGVLEGLNYYLNNFTHSAQEGAKYSYNIYKYCRDALLENSSDLTRFAMPRAALNLFTKHAEQFDEYIYDDYEALFQRITNWAHHKNYDLKKLAYNALDPYYKQLAEMLKAKTKTEEKKCRKIFAFFMTKFFQDLSEEKNLKETVIAIKGYGAFAKPCKQFMEAKDVRRMFVIIIERCEQIFFLTQNLTSSNMPVQQTNEIFDEKIYQLPSFIESLSYICNEIDDSLPEGSVNTLEKLIILAIDNYPKLIKRYNRALSVALIRLFISIQLNKSLYYKNFTSKIIYQSLIRIFSYKTVYRVQLEQQSKQDEQKPKIQTDINTITSKDYVELWSNLLNLQQYEELNAIGINAQDKKHLIKIIYDEYMESIMKIIKKLDLNAIKSAHDSLMNQTQSPSKQQVQQQSTSALDHNDFLSSNPLNNLRAIRPRDFEILINLVDFTRDLLANKHLNLFEKWLFKFSKEIISLSSKYPFISGFYKLITLCMNIAIKIGYFNSINKANIKSLINTSNQDMEVDDVNKDETISDKNESYSADDDTSVRFEKLSCFYLYQKFFKEVFVRMKQFKDELLVSTLEFTLALPKELVEINLSEIFICLETALEIGIGYLPMTENALNSLEYWLKSIKLSKLKPYYRVILDRFDEYLELVQSKSDENESNTEEKSKIFAVAHNKGSGRKKITFKQKVKAFSWTKSTNASDLTEVIQFRILKIFGQLAGQLSHYLYETTKNQLTKEIISWDTKLHIKFAMPFIDLKPTIYFDIFLPRIIHLALSNTNRHIKINSCELLHAIIVYMIGKSVTDPIALSEQQKTQYKDTLDRIYTNLYPILFRLACDVDQFVRNLFQTLVMQMIHWFTGNRKYESKETIILLDCIIECLIDEKNALLRDFSAIALKEFLKWSIKHTPIPKQLDNEGETNRQGSNPVNVKSVLKRLYNLLTHPNCFKRLGGILAWNSIYSIFREEEILVNLYIFELLYYFVECLAMCENDDTMYGTQEQAKLALDHIERIIRVKHELLSQFSAKRVKPYGWSEAVLEVAVRWLLRQCGRVETECRHKSMELVYKLAPQLRGYKDAKEYFQLKYKSDGENYFLQRFEGSESLKKEITSKNYSLGQYPKLTDLIEKSGDSNSNNNVTNEKISQLTQLIKVWLAMLIAPLDCYLWIFNERLLTPLNLFSTNKTIIWKSIGYFIDNIALLDLNELYNKIYSSSTFIENESEFSLFTPNEIEEYRRRKCTSIVRLFDFLTTMLHLHSSSQDVIGIIPEEIWSQNLFTLLIKTCLDPQTIGFNINDIEIYTNLPQLVNNFLRIFMQQTKNSTILAKYKEKLNQICSNLIEKDSNLQIVNDIIAITSNQKDKPIDWFKLTQLVNGYEQLNEFGLYKLPENLSRNLFNYLFDTSTASSDLNVEVSNINRNEILTDNLTCLEAKTKLLNLIFNLNQLELKQHQAHSETDYLIEILDQYIFQKEANKRKINEFLHLYRNEIYLAICKSNDLYVKYLLTKLKINFKLILNVFINLMDYLNYYSNLEKNQRKQYSNKISSSLYTNWANINEYIFNLDKENSGNNSEEKLMVINLLIKLLVVDIPKDINLQKNLFNLYIYLIDDHKTDLNFKCKLLDILYFFSNLKPSSTNVIPSSSGSSSSTATDALMFDFSIKIHLEKFVMNYFPLRSTELNETGALYNDYVNAINKLLVSLELSLSFDLAQVLIMIYTREKQHICENNIKKTLISYIKRVEVLNTSTVMKPMNNMQLDLIQYYWSLWFNMSSKEQMERKLILFKNLILLFLEYCNKQVFIEFMCLNMANLIKILELYELNLKLNTPGDLCDKRCIFELVHLAYKRLSRDEVFSASAKLCQSYETIKFGSLKDGKEFTKEIIRKTRKYLCFMFDNENENENARLLHCSAYNCLVALFMRTQTEPKLYYACLFKDDAAKNELMFEPLIDKNKVYKFNIELENLEQRKTQFVSLRNEFKDGKDTSSDPVYINSISTSTVNPLMAPANDPVSYLNSQNLYESSLSEELSAFDFTSNSHAKQLAASFQASQNTSSSMLMPASHASSQNTTIRKITPANFVSGIGFGVYKSNENQIEIDLDDLNQHESMLSLIELIESLVKNKITPLYDNDQLPTEMPPWMQFFHRKLSDFETHENVKLFLIRGIINTQNVFKSYARFWYPPLISFIVNSKTLCLDGFIDFFTLDLMVLLLSWHKIGIPNQSERKLVIRLFEKLMRNCYHDNKTILKNNLELLKTMTECWKTLIDVPAGIIYMFLKNDEEKKKITGIQLFGLVLSNNIQNYVYPNDISSGNLYESLIQCCDAKKVEKKNIYTSASEVTGMLFNYLNDQLKKKDEERLEEDYYHLRDLLYKILRSSETIDFIYCVYRIQLNFKDICKEFLTKLVFYLPQLYSEPRLLCLESILSAVSYLEDPIYTRPFFNDMLVQRNNGVQLVCLKIIFELNDKISDSNMLKLLPTLLQFVTHTNVACRYQLSEILIKLYNKHINMEFEEYSSEILKLCKSGLLRLLIDNEQVIQCKAFNFWSEKAYLSNNTIDRIVTVLNKMYTSETEYEYLSYSTNLLLEKTSKSPDYNRFIYDNPLTECTFREYNLPVEWWRRHEVMTPLFVETLNTFDQIAESLSQAFGEPNANHLRATQQQSLQFQPTQQAVNGPYNWLTQSSLDTSPINLIASQLTESQTTLLFNTTKKQPGVGLSTDNKSKLDDTDRDIFRLRRRFLRENKSVQSRYHAYKAIKENEKEEAEKKQSKLKKSGQVVKYRQYRIGDFPDIQIKYFELIAPLQALAQRDPKLAMLLFSSLFVSILSEINYLKDENEINDTINQIEVNLNNMLNKSDTYDANFVACIIEIAIKHSSNFQLDTSLISTACLNSLQQTLGIILIEEYIIKNEFIKSKQALNAPTAKRIKLTSKSSDEIKLWIELAKLYRSINDYDSIKGIFARNINLMTSYTREALMYESNYDFYNARKCYIDAIEKDWNNLSDSDGNIESSQPLEIEQELWEQSILRCCDELTDWKQMCDYSTRDTNLNELYMESYSLEYIFPYAFKSKLKLILQEENVNEQKRHQDLIDFIQRIDNVNKQYLEQNYCLELALIYLHQKDFHASKYYAQLCVENYLQDWSSINKTIIQARLTKLQSLQAIIELNEFHKFIDTIEMQQVSEKVLINNVRKLIDLWSNTMPNNYSDPPHTWDDIVTNRCIYFEYIEDKYLNNKNKMELTDEDDYEAIQLRKERRQLMENIEESKLLMKLKFADAARLQSNYKLALNKLQQTRFIIKNDQKKFDHLKLTWMHCYLRTHLSYSTKQFTNIQESLLNILQMSTLNKLIEYDEIAKEICINNRNDLYLDHNIINSQFCKFILDAYFNIENISGFLNELKDDGKLFNQIYSYVNCNGSAKISEDDFCNKPQLTVNSILKRGFDCLKEINYDLKGSFEMAVYCDYFLRLIENDNGESKMLENVEAIKEEYPKVITKQLLNAMRLESYEARQRFPRLIQIVELYPDASLEIFINESATIPCWMFLGWTSQITALLDKKEAKAVHKIIENIAYQYPQALVYPFKMSYESFKFDNNLKEEKEFAQKIHKIMDRIPLVDSFITALEQLTNPDQICKDYLVTIFTQLQAKNIKAIIKSYKDMYSSLFNYTQGTSGVAVTSQSIESDESAWGRIKINFAKQFKVHFDNEFGVNGENIKGLNETQIREKIGRLNGKLSEYRSTDGNLGDYSPWFKKFKRNAAFDLEIPGQYDGKKKPILEYHVKIDSFDERVVALASLRRPKMITIRGNDEKEYKFLVKGGEDQRQDQRVELLFDFMNDLLRADSQCYRRNLSIRTYRVVPMTEKVAIIEWVSNTKTFKDIVRSSLNDNELDKLMKTEATSVMGIYKAFISNASKDKKPANNGELYGNVYLNYKRDYVCEKFDEIQNMFPEDLFRRYIRSMSNSTEGYFLLRNQFIVSYAVAGICQYILGIGDRHLSNWMIDTKTGEAVGIDFGMAFGHATIQLPIPELMPLRLTRQILKLNSPLEQYGILEATMMHTLNALRENNDLLLCLLDVFIKEPSIDWIGSARRVAKKSQFEETDYQIGISYAQERVRSARNKLRGINPCVITREDLLSGMHKESKYTKEMLNVIMGINAINEKGEFINLRTKLLKDKKPSYQLSVEEQVKCIIEQSTDPDILGRTWIGWEPFI